MEAMTTYIVICWDGETKIISARTQSDAYQQAAAFAADHSGISSFEEV